MRLPVSLSRKKWNFRGKAGHLLEKERQCSMVCASQNCPIMRKQCHCEGYLLLLTATLLSPSLSSGFCGGAGQPHQATSQNRRGPACATRQAAQSNTGAGGQGTGASSSSRLRISHLITLQESMAQRCIRASHPSRLQFQGIGEGMNNFYYSQVPFWVRDCYAARQGATARPRNNHGLSSAKLPTGCSIFWLSIFFFFSPLSLCIILLFFHWSSKHYFLALSSFPIFTPIENHVLQFYISH